MLVALIKLDLLRANPAYYNTGVGRAGIDTTAISHCCCGTYDNSEWRYLDLTCGTPIYSEA